MVKWLNTVIKWCKNIDLHLVMVKWSNEYMVKWCREYTQVHMVKWWNTLAEISSSQNGKMAILHFFGALLRAPLESIICCVCRLVYWRCRVDGLIFPRSAPTLFNSVSPRWFWSIHFLFAFLMPPPTLRGFVPFCNLLLAIVWCSYTGDVLYYLCATVTYTTFTSSIWYPHDFFAKAYF